MPIKFCKSFQCQTSRETSLNKNSFINFPLKITAITGKGRSFLTLPFLIFFDGRETKPHASVTTTTTRAKADGRFINLVTKYVIGLTGCINYRVHLYLTN